MSSARPACGPISTYSRVQILHLVQSRSPRTIGDLCDATGLHQNTIREHLQRLIEGGYIIASTERRTTRGRPRTLYSAATGTPEASSDVAREKISAAARRGDLMRRALPQTASDLGTEAAHQLDALIEHLEESGFEPVIDDDQLTVDLTPCPHAAARPEDRPVLCRVHLGLMQGVLTQAGGPLAADFVQEPAVPEECTVQLRLAGAA
ncbi:putative ArsR family transcriptional regulator [Microbacterium ginsengiterrae]|uniref:Putative ArsR family transcriptional regulator n=1 Tax=Microbacterium ginsengiterrae TaxID=546115 RepID=A0A7W9CAX8_9MICO|nr:ArsR family transcriptional regulator [Microbacterium ginsengiterrae]MBB5742269.1 putative ArsR family transcriptional regulator [Microbacterium ginsengiterrae]